LKSFLAPVSGLSSSNYLLSATFVALFGLFIVFAVFSGNS
jgi:hypothetical protein